MLYSPLAAYGIYNLLQDIMGKHPLKCVCSFGSVHLLNWVTLGFPNLAKIIHGGIKRTLFIYGENFIVEAEWSNGLDDNSYCL